jgi:regulator of replication initiation timing
LGKWPFSFHLQLVKHQSLKADSTVVGKEDDMLLYNNNLLEIVSKLNVKLKEINYLQLENVKLQERMDNLEQQKGPLRLEITF